MPVDNCKTTQGNKTLVYTLGLQGGKNDCGAREILMRAAVAALLNAAHPNVLYPLSTADILASVNAALATGNRKAIIDLATQLDNYNNLLRCPLN
jgi:hypothetical protein